MHKYLALAMLLFAAIPSAAHAGQLTYAYTGTVTVATSPPFGQSIPAFSPVSGQFTYDTNSPATHTFGTSTGYLQQTPNGFTGTFGGVNVRADEYLVIVANDEPQPGGSTADRLSIAFASNFTPALGEPLVVNGADQAIGLFRVNLVGSNSLFTSPALPSSINLVDFPSRVSFLSDTPTDLVDVIFTVNSLVQVPEPATAHLLVAGAGVVLIVARRSRRNRGRSRGRSDASRTIS